MTPLPGDPVETMKLRRELDFVVTTRQEGKGLGCGSLERPRSRAEDMSGIEEGPYFTITIEMCNGTLSSARIAHFDRPEGDDVNENGLAIQKRSTYTIAT